MRKSTSLLLILTLMFVTMGDDCGSNSGIPNPGFRLLCIRKVGSSEDAIRGARTDGTLRARADNATGIRENFSLNPAVLDRLMFLMVSHPRFGVWMPSM